MRDYGEKEIVLSGGMSLLSKSIDAYFFVALVHPAVLPRLLNRLHSIDNCVTRTIVYNDLTASKAAFACSTTHHRGY